jgi:hypothetical protein
VSEKFSLSRVSCFLVKGIGVIHEHPFPAIAASYHVTDGTRTMQTNLSRHAARLPLSAPPVNQNRNPNLNPNLNLFRFLGKTSAIPQSGSGVESSSVKSV